MRSQRPICTMKWKKTSTTRCVLVATTGLPCLEDGCERWGVAAVNSLLTERRATKVPGRVDVAARLGGAAAYGRHAPERAGCGKSLRQPTAPMMEAHATHEDRA